MTDVVVISSLPAKPNLSSLFFKWFYLFRQSWKCAHECEYKLQFTAKSSCCSIFDIGIIQSYFDLETAVSLEMPIQIQCSVAMWVWVWVRVCDWLTDSRQRDNLGQSKRRFISFSTWFFSPVFIKQHNKKFIRQCQQRWW